MEPMRGKYWHSQPIVLESFEDARNLAETNPADPRPCVVKGWEPLAKALLIMTNVFGENVEPLSEDVRARA